MRSKRIHLQFYDVKLFHAVLEIVSKSAYLTAVINGEPGVVERLSKELKDLREVKGLSLREVERKTGISNAYLSQLERGDAENPTPEKLQKLARCYEVPYVDLMRAAGYLSESADGGPADLSRFQIALMGADLTKAEQEQVLNFIKFLKSQK